MGRTPDRHLSGQFADERVTLTLRILETTDLHGHVRAYDYFTDRPAPNSGFAALASEIERARSEQPNTLLFDCGDYLQGTPMTQLWGQEADTCPDCPHPMIAAMNTVGYDAVALGNHEFDFGIPRLDRALKDADFPVVCANLTFGTKRAPTRWIMLERKVIGEHGLAYSLRIAVLGLLPPTTLGWMQARNTDQFAMSGLLDAACDTLAEIRAAEPDLVIALAHTGIAPLPPMPVLDKIVGRRAEQAALAVARLDGIDVVLAGHDHRRFPDPDFPPSDEIDPQAGTLHGKPALNAGTRGTHLGVLDLELKHLRGRWRIARHKASLRHVGHGHTADTPPPGESARVLAASAPAHARTLTHIRREIGQSDCALHSFFSLIAPDRALALIAEVKRKHARRCLAGRPEAELPLLTAVSSFRSGGLAGPDNFVDIAPGPLRLSHLDDLYLFNNVLGAVEITGAELRDWLEQSASIFRQLMPGAQNQPLRDAAFASYHFDVISGLSYAIDLREPARYSVNGRRVAPQSHRIKDLRLSDGNPVADSDRFVLLSNDFRLSGGNGYLARGQPVVLEPEPALIRDLIYHEVVATGKPLRIDASAIWRFLPMPGTRALYQTGPGALTHLAELGQAGISARALPFDESGFLNLEIKL